MDSKELISNYEERLKSAGYPDVLFRYLSTLAHQVFVSIDTLNSFTECKFVVSLENM